MSQRLVSFRFGSHTVKTRQALLFGGIMKEGDEVSKDTCIGKYRFLGCKEIAIFTVLVLGVEVPFVICFPPSNFAIYVH